MAPSAVSISGPDGFLDDEDPAAKRRRTGPKDKSGSHHAEPEHEVDDDEPVAIQSHPLGVKPSGNAYTASANLKFASGTFSTLPDELLMEFLDCLEADELTTLGSTCKALYALTRADELWRDLFVRSRPRDFTWNGTWRATYLRKPQRVFSRIDCSGLFSDALHRPFFCAHTPLAPYADNIPARNAITRLPNLTEEEFHNTWTHKPFILTEPVKEWPIYQTWDADTLLAQYAHISFRAEAVDWPLETYINYMRNNADESPLYLFDHSFVEKMSLTVDPSPGTTTTTTPAYTLPAPFTTDFFSVLRTSRPHRRWLILGPPRSGSTFHRDPNATSAWNAVLRGRKYWLMFPRPPPGIVLSPDHAEITAPLSIAEYLLTFHALARATPGCVEGVCEAGEVLYVPSGWFHLVLNLEEGVAVTGNFVPRGGVPDVLRFLAEKGEQVSGFADGVGDPYGLWVERMGEEWPEVLAEGRRVLEGRAKKWVDVVKGDEEGGGGGGGVGGFTFGFGEDSDAEVP